MSKNIFTIILGSLIFTSAIAAGIPTSGKLYVLNTLELEKRFSRHNSSFFVKQTGPSLNPFIFQKTKCWLEKDYSFNQTKRVVLFPNIYPVTIKTQKYYDSKGQFNYTSIFMIINNSLTLTCTSENQDASLDEVNELLRGELFISSK